MAAKKKSLAAALGLKPKKRAKHCILCGQQIPAPTTPRRRTSAPKARRG